MSMQGSRRSSVPAIWKLSPSSLGLPKGSFHNVSRTAVFRIVMTNVIDSHFLYSAKVDLQTRASHEEGRLAQHAMTRVEDRHLCVKPKVIFTPNF
jgi:hypothetical protein